MGRRQGTTVPFEREELERLAQATSSTADYRPTSKLSRDELLGLVARSAGPLAETYVHDPVPAKEPARRTPEPAPAPSGAQVPPLGEPVPAPDEAHVQPPGEGHVPQHAVAANREPAGEHRPREALRALTAPDSLRDDYASRGDAIVRPVAPRRGVPVLVSIALVVTVAIAVLFLVL